MTTAYLGLGGNLGDPAAAMAASLRLLDARPDTSVTSASRLFRTPPWGLTDQPWFLNACAKVETTASADDLLDACLTIERGLKRERRERWGPRTIDIDILVYGERSSRSERLSLPHPRLTERAFVLAPLADLAPALVVGGRSVADWLAGLSENAAVPLGETRDWWRRGLSGSDEIPNPSAF